MYICIYDDFNVHCAITIINNMFLFTENSGFGYTAYRQLVRWCRGRLGRYIWTPLSSCAVLAIRLKFPEGGRTWFKCASSE